MDTNIADRNIEAVWLVIIPIFGLVFIAKRIIFNQKLKQNTNFEDIIIYTVLCAILIVFFYGPSNPLYMSFGMTFFMIGLIIWAGMFMKYVHNKLFTKPIS